MCSSINIHRQCSTFYLLHALLLLFLSLSKLIFPTHTVSFVKFFRWTNRLFSRDQFIARLRLQLDFTIVVYPLFARQSEKVTNATYSWWNYLLFPFTTTLAYVKEI